MAELVGEGSRGHRGIAVGVGKEQDQLALERGGEPARAGDHVVDRARGSATVGTIELHDEHRVRHHQVRAETAGPVQQPVGVLAGITEEIVQQFTADAILGLDPGTQTQQVAEP